MITVHIMGLGRKLSNILKSIRTTSCPAMVDKTVDAPKDKLPSVFSLAPSTINECCAAEDISRLLGYSYAELSKLIYPSTTRLYRHFSIPKKSGTERTIEAPKRKLKKIQRTLVLELQQYFQPRPSAHGFIKERSIVSNAVPHVNKSFVFNIDLEDFFGSIHFGRVKNLFTAHPFALTHTVATILAQICCNKGRLPQGAPTSPIISNMICHKLDRQLQALAGKNQSTYTRYADDITFSFTTTRENLPSNIVYFDKNNELNTGILLRKIITDNGFRINSKKVRIKPKSQKQEVTGLTVNKKTNVTRSFVRQTSSMLYAWKKFGLIAAEKHYIDKYRKKKLMARHQLKVDAGGGEFFIKVIKGRINFIKMVIGKDDIIYKKLAFRLTEAFGKPNKRYLMSAIDKICESIFILENNYESGSQGTAFCLEHVGIVTNFHVVPGIDDSSDVNIDFFRHNEVSKIRKAKIKKLNYDIDLAIFEKTSDFSDIDDLIIGDDSKLSQYDRVVVIGFPQYNKGDRPYINEGKIIQQTRYLGGNYWLIDIPILHGTSGGVVLNENLQVIGVATLGSAVHDGSTKFHGFIPITTLINFSTSSR